MAPKAAKNTRWGYGLDEWDVARDQLRTALVARARAHATVSYADACAEITVARFRHYSWSFMALLDEVCRLEDGANGTILASLVVRRDSGMPGEGYFTWAARSGHDVTDREAFWRTEAARVWAAYGGESAAS
jgi:hypothetical protein